MGISMTWTQWSCWCQQTLKMYQSLLTECGKLHLSFVLTANTEKKCKATEGRLVLFSHSNSEQPSRVGEHKKNGAVAIISISTKKIWAEIRADRQLAGAFHTRKIVLG